MQCACRNGQIQTVHTNGELLTYMVAAFIAGGLAALLFLVVAGPTEHTARDRAVDLERELDRRTHEVEILTPLAKARIGLVTADLERIADSLAVQLERNGPIYLVQGR